MPSPKPHSGALSLTFTAMRAMQFIALVTVIGLTSNFVSEIIAAHQAAPDYLVGTLVVSCVATIYISITYLLYHDAMLPLLAATACDTVLLAALLVVASVMGRPVSYLSCTATDPTHAAAPTSTAAFFTSLAVSAYTHAAVAAVDRAMCLELKAVWGLAIALCVLFSFSAVAAACLWHKHRVAPAAAAADEEKAPPA